jgi:hypothetical protein
MVEIPREEKEEKKNEEKPISSPPLSLFFFFLLPCPSVNMKERRERDGERECVCVWLR